MVVRTDKPVVLDDSAPIQVEVLVNTDVSGRTDQRIEFELVRLNEDTDGAVIDTQTLGPLDKSRYSAVFAAAKTPNGRYRVRARLTQGDATIGES